MRTLIRLAAAAALATLAGACMSSFDQDWGSLERTDAPLGANFGLAVASMDNQIIDPTPALGPPETSGAKAAAAIRRYERGRVRQPQQGTSAFMGTDGGGDEDSGSGSGGGGGPSGGGGGGAASGGPRP
ncbi:hypothetical protein [Phenylobacterium sp.]|jgi:uncharacterized membrane protein YgcG|uniref:hypothetical protein n=1 Tax=Phenylobacterium sp. TaxID=1871053 RepID=UPI002F93A4C5